MTSPTVSVVIPAHNASTTLSATVDSVLGQSFSDLEVVIVDDGSTDDTYSMASSLSDPRIRAVRQENGGAPSARNAGIGEATGDYVAFLDADDLWFPNKLERHLEFMRQRGALASQTALWFVNDSLRRLHRGSCPQFSDPLLDVLLFRHMPGLMSTLVVERQFLQQVGLFDESLAILEDWEIAIRLARGGRFLNLDEALTMYRLHPDNRSLDLEIHIAPGLEVLERVFSDPSLPAHIRRKRARIYAAMYAMYSGGALRAGRYRDSALWASRAIKSHPSALGAVLGLPVRRMRRRLSLRGSQ